ncbi:MAG: 2,3-diketo-5-methylthiopentyl-1-phosphate enolase [Firmicutes bacterium]|nr:2,3-diketo-5-methylthiopentyl-1-phosphate enolase [Bacillota bacterium]MCL5063981.1 2,3-diketo-5-methylthiopentyl-1-phosphate enolase [Bacillota bacterium]
MKQYVEATYQVPWESHLEQRAHAIAVGMTVGSWTDVPALQQPHLRAFLGEVSRVEQRDRLGIFSIRYPLDNVRANIGSLLTVIFGKLSLDGSIRLIDLSLPDVYLSQFPGPYLGLDGLRSRLGIHRRPLIMSIFKSENGRTLQQFRTALKDQLDGGVDFVKDDEIFIADTDCPLLDRVQVAAEVLAERYHQTGQRGLYFANLVGTPQEIFDQALSAQEAGASGFLLSPYSQGLDVLTDLRRAHLEVPLIAHPAFSGGQIRDHGFGIDPAIYLGLLPRMVGADIVLFPSPYGSVALKKQSALAISHALTHPSVWPTVVPGPSAGIHVGMLPQLLQDFGVDLVVNAGGAVHGHPQGTQAGAKALVEGVKACLMQMHLFPAEAEW